MNPNPDKTDDAVLAIVHLTSFTDGPGPSSVTRAWKEHDWAALDRLHAKGFIHNPRGKAQSVVLTQEGASQTAGVLQDLLSD